MQKLKLLFTFSLFIFHFSHSYAQSWCWGKEGAAGVKDDDYGAACATDKYGYGYFTGQYATQMTIDTTTLLDNDDEMFLVRFNPAGELLWARQAVSDTSAPSSSYGLGVITDNGDNIYATGYYVGQIIFGPDTLSRTSNGFLVKYNPAGTVLWALSFSGYGQTVTTDKYDNVYVGTFDGSGLYKYDVNGNLLWNIKDNSESLAIYSVTTDKAQNVYITGNINYNTKIGNDSLFAPFGENEMVLVKLTPAGSVLWAEQSKASNDTAKIRNGWGQAVITNAADVYVSGYFEDTLAWGAYTLTTKKADTDAFLAEYDSTGRLLWVKQSTGNGAWMGYSLAKDENNHIYLGGSGTGDTISFGGMTLPAKHSPNYSGSSFIFMLNTLGNASVGSVLDNGVGPALYGSYRIGISSDSTGNFIYMAGTLFDDTVLCGPDSLIANYGGVTPYFARWAHSECVEQINTGEPQVAQQKATILLYPNPGNGQFTIQSSVVSGKLSVEVYNMLGEKVYSQFTTHPSQFTIDLSSNPNGVYLYRVISESGNAIGSGKLIIQK